LLYFLNHYALPCNFYLKQFVLLINILFTKVKGF
jgi:hypothetical protein